MASLRDREVACSASDRQGSNFESCVWRTVSSKSSHHPQEVLLAQFSLYVHKGGLKPDSFHFITTLWDAQHHLTTLWTPRTTLQRSGRPAPRYNALDAPHHATTLWTSRTTLQRSERPAPLYNALDAPRHPTTLCTASTTLQRSGRPTPPYNALDATHHATTL